MTYRYLPEARNELERQIGHYESKQLGLGLEFLSEVEAAISRALEFPHAWTEIVPDIRRCLTQRFPYGVLYHLAEESQEIIIVAVMHLHQRPDYWEARKF